MEIDNKLNFSKRVSNVYKKINNQFNVMLRFRKLIRREILFRLYRAYIFPHFYYCSSIWHFCGTRDADKLEALNKKYLDLYLKITCLHTTLFFQKSALLRCVTNAFKISSFCYIRVCFSLIFLLI